MKLGNTPHATRDASYMCESPFHCEPIWVCGKGNHKEDPPMGYQQDASAEFCLPGRPSIAPRAAERGAHTEAGLVFLPAVRGGFSPDTQWAASIFSPFARFHCDSQLIALKTGSEGLVWEGSRVISAFGGPGLGKATRMGTDSVAVGIGILMCGSPTCWPLRFRCPSFVVRRQ